MIKNNAYGSFCAWNRPYRPGFKTSGSTPGPRAHSAYLKTNVTLPWIRIHSGREDEPIVIDPHELQTP